MVKSGKVGVKPSLCKNCKLQKEKSKEVITYKNGLYLNSKKMVVKVDPYGIGLRKHR